MKYSIVNGEISEHITSYDGNYLKIYTWIHYVQMLIAWIILKRYSGNIDEDVGVNEK